MWVWTLLNARLRETRDLPAALAQQDAAADFDLAWRELEVIGNAFPCVLTELAATRAACELLVESPAQNLRTPPATPQTVGLALP